jgi:DNA-binding NtrC family response regulator
MTDDVQSSARRRVLIIDNEKTILFSVGRYLRLQGFEVDCSRHWTEAQALLGERRYDVVITDLRLSGSDSAEGIEIISYVRKHAPAAKSVLLTAYGTPEVLDEAYSRGVAAILAKPVSLDEVLRTLNSLIHADG